MAETLADAKIEPLKPEIKISTEIDPTELANYGGAPLSPTRSNDSTLTGSESPRPQISDDTSQLVTAPVNENGYVWVEGGVLVFTFFHSSLISRRLDTRHLCIEIVR